MNPPHAQQRQAWIGVRLDDDTGEFVNVVDGQPIGFAPDNIVDGEGGEDDGICVQVKDDRDFQREACDDTDDVVCCELGKTPTHASRAPARSRAHPHDRWLARLLMPRQFPQGLQAQLERDWIEAVFWFGPPGATTEVGSR